MTDFVLKAETRPAAGSAIARRERRSGRIPAVLYGQGKETVHLSFDEGQLGALLRRNARIIDVDLDGDTQRALIKDIQTDVYAEEVLHLDLQRVVIGETITVEVGLEFFGTPKGVADGSGQLQTPLTKMAIQCIPSQIPAAIEVDVRELAVGEMLRVGDVVLPEGIATEEAPDQVVASVVAVAEEEEAESPDLEGPAEPELIGREGEGGAED
jgi:large subunit ribosomal protein L25